MNDRQQLCTFLLNGQHFGIEVEEVQEVIRYQDVTPVPRAPEEVSGLINLRGQIITAIDLRVCLHLPRREDENPPMNVVVRSDGGPVSLLVDQIGDVVEVEEEWFEPTPDTVQDSSRDLIRGAYKLKDRLLLVLEKQKAIRAVAA